MRRENTIDYDDMLLLATRLLRGCERTRRKYAAHWQHMLVDEFQDTNGVQYQLVSLLGKDHGNVFVVGDVDQAIYGWRGADIRNQATATLTLTLILAALTFADIRNQASLTLTLTLTLADTRHQARLDADSEIGPTSTSQPPLPPSPPPPVTRRALTQTS